jgi:ATP-binding cassette subfamily B protein
MQYIDGKIENVGVIVEFLLYVNMLTWPVASVGWITSMVQRAEASQERINEFLSESPNVKNYSPDSSEVIKGEIEFKNVSFTYEDTNIVALRNISFKVKKGFNLDNLRQQLGYVPQDAFLFSSSIRDNIKFGKADATEEDIINAAKNAAVHSNIIEFSKGYDTILGERGITLSGGQKQRVSIARAIIKDPQIVLFDDCLSAVDTETEEEIFNKLNKISNNKTSVVVSHRASSAKNANHIIVLDDGEILEEGTHAELIAQNGYYKDLYNKQLSEKES